MADRAVVMKVRAVEVVAGAVEDNNDHDNHNN